MKPRKGLSNRPRSSGSQGAGGKTVFSYYASGSQQPADSQHRISSGSFLQQRWVRNLPSLIMLIILLGSFLYCLGLSTNPRVNIATPSGGSGLRSSATYQQGAQAILEESLFSRTKLTVDTGGFKRAFQAKFPEVAEVSVALPLIGHRPVISITTAQPQLILTTTSNQAYALDARGVAIMPASDLRSQQSLTVVNDQSGLAISLGKVALSSSNVAFIASVIRQLAAAHLQASSVVLPPVPHEVDMHIAGQPYLVKFSFDTDSRVAAGTYLAAKQYLGRTNTPVGQYIDARVPGRIYYK